MKVRRLIPPNVEKYTLLLENATQRLDELQEKACQVHSELQTEFGKLRAALDGFETLKEIYPMEDFSITEAMSCLSKMKETKSKAKTIARAFYTGNKCDLCELNGSVTNTSFNCRMLGCCHAKLCATCMDSLPVKLCEAHSTDDFGPTGVRLELTRTCPFCRSRGWQKKVINCAEYAFRIASEAESDTEQDYVRVI